MEIRNLLTFIEVANLQNFTQASKVLGYSQSNISAQIRQLEEELGVVLFERMARGVHLTQYGQELPKNREQDMIYTCGEIISGSVLSHELNTQGIKSVFLTGGQAGIETDDHYSEANILTVHTDSLERWLAKGYVVIVAGGQGMTASGDITAIGRGGSDTTACVIGYYTGADQVRIYTDVDGIYTGDPRVIKRARKIPYLSYGQCHRLASYGAKVIHPRAVAYSERGRHRGSRGGSIRRLPDLRGRIRGKHARWAKTAGETDKRYHSITEQL